MAPKPKIQSRTGRKAGGIHAARKAFGQGATPKLPTVQKAPKAPTKAGAGGSLVPPGLSSSGRKLFERLQTPAEGSFSAEQALAHAREHDREAKASAARRRAVLKGSFNPSEQMMANEANRQSRERSAMASPAQVGARNVGAPAGGGSRPKISMARATPKQRPVKASSGPLVRGSSGAVNLRGGSRSKWKRDMLGRFA